MNSLNSHHGPLIKLWSSNNHHLSIQLNNLILLIMRRQAPKDTAYTRWSCHSGMANPVQIVSTLPALSNRGLVTVFLASRSCGPVGWMVLLLIKAGYVKTNPGPTNTRKQVWICDICHIQIQVRKQISISFNRIEHWVPL